MSRFKLLFARLAFFATVVLAVGCVPTARHFTRAATEGVIEGAADAMAKNPDAQKKIAKGIDEDAIQEVTRKSSGGVIDGTLDSLDDKERRQRLTNEVAAITSTLTTTLVQSAGNAALSDANQKKVAAMTGALIRMVKSEVLPDQATVDKMMLVVRELVKNMTLGFQDAVDETHAKRESGELGKGEGSVLNALGQAAESGNEMLYMIGLLVGVLSILALAIAIWAWRSSRAHRKELAERDEAFMLMAEAIKGTEEQPWSGELREALRDKMRGHHSSEYVRKLLRKNPALRLNSKGQVVRASQTDLRPSLPQSERLGHA